MSCVGGEKKITVFTDKTKKMIERANENQEEFFDFPIHLLLLFFGFLYGTFYIYTLINKQIYLPVYEGLRSGEIFLKKISVYGYLFPLSIILSGSLTFCARISFNKINFLRFMSFYVTVTFILYFIFAGALLIIGFGGWGNAEILHFKPVTLLMGLIFCIPTKYTIISLTFYIFWTILFYITTNNSIQLKVTYNINTKIFSLIFSVIGIAVIGITWGDTIKVATIILMLAFILYFPFVYKKDKIVYHTQKGILVLFILATFLPVLYDCLGQSKFLLNFTYK